MTISHSALVAGIDSYANCYPIGREGSFISVSKQLGFGHSSFFNPFFYIAFPPSFILTLSSFEVLLVGVSLDENCAHSFANQWMNPFFSQRTLFSSINYLPHQLFAKGGITCVEEIIQSILEELFSWPYHNRIETDRFTLFDLSFWHLPPHAELLHGAQYKLLP